jgi:hypothetical protein
MHNRIAQSTSLRIKTRQKNDNTSARLQATFNARIPETSQVHTRSKSAKSHALPQHRASSDALQKLHATRHQHRNLQYNILMRDHKHSRTTAAHQVQQRCSTLKSTYSRIKASVQTEQTLTHKNQKKAQTDMNLTKRYTTTIGCNRSKYQTTHWFIAENTLH